MANEPGYYSQYYISFNGTLLGESTEVEAKSENTDTNVATLLKDFAGVTPGPLMSVVTVKNMVPVGGTEFNYGDKERKREKITVGIQEGGSGKKFKSVMFVRNVSHRGSVGANAEVSFELHGQHAVFE